MGKNEATAATILVVEDNEEFLYAAEKTLREAGYNVKIAPGYQAALDFLVRPDRLDLLLTDVVMPNGINGFALARMARMRRPQLKVLYMTAFDVPEQEAMAKILRKPISPAVLVEEIREALAAQVC